MLEVGISTGILLDVAHQIKQVHCRLDLSNLHTPLPNHSPMPSWLNSRVYFTHLIPDLGGHGGEDLCYDGSLTSLHEVHADVLLVHTLTHSLRTQTDT